MSCGISLFLRLQLCRSEVDEGVLLAGCEYWASLCEASVSEDKSTRALFLSKLGEYVAQVSLCLQFSVCY